MKPIVRGQFRFRITDQDLVEIWLGEPNLGESEYVGSFHHSFLSEIIAGLTALKQVTS